MRSSPVDAGWFELDGSDGPLKHAMMDKMKSDGTNTHITRKERRMVKQLMEFMLHRVRELEEENKELKGKIDDSYAHVARLVDKAKLTSNEIKQTFSIVKALERENNQVREKMSDLELDLETAKMDLENESELLSKQTKRAESLEKKIDWWKVKVRVHEEMELSRSAKLDDLQKEMRTAEEKAGDVVDILSQLMGKVGIDK